MDNLFPPHQESICSHIIKGVDGEAERKSLGAQPTAESVGYVTSHAQEGSTCLSLNQATWRSEVANA